MVSVCRVRLPGSIGMACAIVYKKWPGLPPGTAGGDQQENAGPLAWPGSTRAFFLHLDQLGGGKPVMPRQVLPV